MGRRPGRGDRPRPPGRPQLRQPPGVPLRPARKMRTARRHRIAASLHLAIRDRLDVPNMETPVDDRWYKDAIVYAVDVGTFQDGNGDGIGDLAGLRSRLDYLVDLGVTCLWLLPFYP